jgi:hypothetical protein
MIDVTYTSLKHALDAEVDNEIIGSIRPISGYALTRITDSSLTYVNQNPRVSWILHFYSHDWIVSLKALGEILLARGFGEYGVLRFPNQFGWAQQEEALAFWTQILPVKPYQILLATFELNMVFIQFANGTIVSLTLQLDGNDIEDADAIKTIFTKIIESNLTT